jgi:hypothetical protein
MLFMLGSSKCGISKREGRAINLSADCAGAAKRIKATGTGSRYQETEIKTTNKSGEGRKKVFAIKHSFKGG